MRIFADKPLKENDWHSILRIEPALKDVADTGGTNYVNYANFYGGKDHGTDYSV